MLNEEHRAATVALVVIDLTSFAGPPSVLSARVMPVGMSALHQ